MNMQKRNLTFTALSSIGILLVVSGHINLPLFTIGEFFPYYSFHVSLFYFISGYFYKPVHEMKATRYLLHKCKTLLLPYFIWNLCYGLLTILLHGFQFEIGNTISLYTLFIAPILDGHQFMYNFAAWFVPALFLVELCNIIGRKLLSAIAPQNEYLIMILYLIIGLAAVFLAKRGSVYDYYRLPARIMFALPFYQMGQLYKQKLESRDRLPSLIYFPILFAVQLFIITTSGGLAYSSVWVSSFANSIFMPFITSITGIAFWLRIAKIITPLFEKSNFLTFMGENTFSIMMHHIFSFMILKMGFAFLYSYTPLCQDFDLTLFHTSVDYYYLPNGFTQFQWLYLFVGIMLPLGIAYLCKRCYKLANRF